MSSLHPRMEDVISRHFPKLNSPLVEPQHRGDDEHRTLALIVASSTLREQLHEQLGDQLDIRVAFAITAAVVPAFEEAGGTR